VDKPHPRFNGSESVFDALCAVEELDQDIVHALGDAGYALMHSIAVHAPGTLFHSLRVLEIMQAAGYATFADEAAAVLVHDCGKLVGPSAFAENGGASEPPAWMLAGHVDYGMFIAEDINMGALQRQAILEHHGTQQVGSREEGKRYGGQRPGSLFTAVLMMADTMEAITAGQGRERAVALLPKIAEQRIADGQFEDVGAARVREATRRLVDAPALEPLELTSKRLGLDLGAGDSGLGL
jgi:membrane-associated HD superfamily phosphohydrolase